MENAQVSIEELDNDEAGFESVQPTYRTADKNLFPGDVTTGSFVRSEPNKFDGLNYILRTASGIQVFNGCGSLNNQMEAAGAVAGDTLRITYEGKKTLTEGKWKGKDALQYKVAIKRQR